MARGIKLLPGALVDVADAQAFYEEQSLNLGLHFREMLNADLRDLLISAGVHRKVYGLHRCVCKRFPFAIFYRVEIDTVAVYAVLDCRGDPGDLRARILGRS